ncbi:unnamed protein product [Litomosoides sigmodontis]|uniref:Tetratricopeptide repeat protein 30 n=1 Tax=Litomosoides sigmodontis TaxID=42156 RepID=A0A3P6U7Z9_LITSI|nr:unnamed protein product [Litomosoides sigmodontis]
MPEVTVGSDGDSQCEKCKKNEEKYKTKPTICMYCQLQAAFVANKCVWCCHAERKYGLPVQCSQCLQKCAFVREPLEKDKPLYCRLCTMSRKAMFGETTAHSNMSKSKNSSHRRRKRPNSSEKRGGKVSKRNAMTETVLDNVHSEHIFVIQQYKDEILELQKKCFEKDRVILERDKKIAELNAEIIMQEQQSKMKITMMQKQHAESLQSLHEQIRTLSKQIRLLWRSFHNPERLKRGDGLLSYVTCEIGTEKKMPFAPIKDGEFTSTIYGMIKEGRYESAIRPLQYELQRKPNSRAALSLLGYCYFYLQQFIEAAECYEQLVQLHSSYPEYRLYWAQSLYNAFMFPEATVVVSQIDEPQFAQQVLKLESAIKYREEDITNARILVEKYAADDPDGDINLACLDYKEGSYEKALERFTAATHLHGYQPCLVYSIALCHYQMRNYSQSLKFIADIIDRGVQDHPELSIGLATEGLEVSSVGNTRLLHETSLVEACNLKAAIEYNLKNLSAASEALTDMPPRLEEELDPVTLHNQALINMDTNPSDGFAKLQYLLSQNPFPPETFRNLLLLYCKYEYYNLAADVLAENAHLTYKYLTQYLYDYIDAVITQQTAPLEAYNKFEAIGNEQINELRKLTRRINEISHGNNEMIVQSAMKAYDDTMAKYMPVLMSQAKIYWDMNDYTQVEKIFRKSVEFCSENDIWKLNVAHTLFMQADKFKEAAGFYEPNVKKNFDNMLSVTAIILANLSVCYIMTNQNEEAEELMKKVEREEVEASAKASNKTKFFHLSIINLVIGTLYCSKGNYEFGISRVIKAMEPYDMKLGTDTWFYSKRCMISLIENLAKHIISVRDSVLQECLQFLEQCEIHGKDIPTTIADPLIVNELEAETVENTVTYEARLLRALLLEVMNN